MKAELEWNYVSILRMCDLKIPGVSESTDVLVHAREGILQA